MLNNYTGECDTYLISLSAFPGHWELVGKEQIHDKLKNLFSRIPEKDFQQSPLSEDYRGLRVTRLILRSGIN